jgi:lipopolysaccharide biosynthesis protein
MNRSMGIRTIVFYLPQFHPIPENDAWWGAGFTEWTNVASARPLFRNHYQPHIPADLGFYDVRLPETRAAQAELARNYGIEGFCYYHYWFEGKRLLERPFDDVLNSGEPDFPFCLCWANETWSRRWLGEERSVLQKQTYSFDDDHRHGEWLAKAFADRRYLRVKNRPLFLIYRPRDLPDPVKTMDIFRKASVRRGLPEPYILGADAHCSRHDCKEFGCDGTLQFEPQLSVLPDFNNDSASLSKLRRNLRFHVPSAKLKLYDYEDARRRMLAKKRAHETVPCVCVGWDNTPRRGRNGIILLNNTPEKFEAGLASMAARVISKPADERIIFLNAWNEWAEGNHLEPDERFGHGYLQAVRRVLEDCGELA